MVYPPAVFSLITPQGFDPLFKPLLHPQKRNDSAAFVFQQNLNVKGLVRLDDLSIRAMVGLNQVQILPHENLLQDQGKGDYNNQKNNHHLFSSGTVTSCRIC